MMRMPTSRRRRSISSVLLSGLIGMSGGTEVLASGDLPAGEIVDKVACRGTATQSYALYLPSTYTPDRPWPVLYAMDPRKRGRLPVQLFRDAAERYGYIVIGSHNTMSDHANALRDNMRALTVLWKDTHDRFSIDDSRVYLTGMSGGARSACYRADLGPEKIAGVIACAAGFSPMRAPHAELGFSVFGAIGNRDYNFLELIDLDGVLDGLGLPNRMVSFDGPHGWPPADVAMEAIEWLEVRAMKEARRPADPEHARALLESAIARVERRTTAGDLIGASSARADILRDFEGLTDNMALRTEWERLDNSKALRRARRDREKIVADEAKYVARLQQGAFSGITEDNADKSLGKVLDRLEVKKVKKLAASNEPEEKLSGQRRLSHILGQTAFYIPNQMEASESYARAALSLRAANEIRPGQPRVLYRLARVEALRGRADDAMRTLGEAVAAGYDPAKFGRRADGVEQDPGFASLTDRADFRALVEKLHGPTDH